MNGNMLTTRLAEQQKPTRNLHQFVEEANRNWFVRDSGKPYFVNERPGPDGVMVEFMDRRI